LLVQQVRSPGVAIPRLPLINPGSSPAALPVACGCTTPGVISAATAQAPAAAAVSPIVSVAASALTAFLKKENQVVAAASQLIAGPPPAASTTLAKLSPHDVALKGRPDSSRFKAGSN